jgi:hypothetical protein
MINGFVTSEESLEVSIQPGDALANSVNPGSWETKAVAAGGFGIVWKSTPDITLTTPEQNVGATCKVTPSYRPRTARVTVETEISTDKGQTYKPYKGEMEIQFVTAGVFTQLALVASSGQEVIGYKKV